jgi:hypothetical protein
MAVIHYSVERHAFGPTSHVLQEVLETKPARVNQNPDSPVVLEANTLWIKAAGEHALPTDVLWRCFPVGSVTVLGTHTSTFSCSLSRQAAA